MLKAKLAALALLALVLPARAQTPTTETSITGTAANLQVASFTFPNGALLTVHCNYYPNPTAVTVQLAGEALPTTINNAPFTCSMPQINGIYETSVDGTLTVTTQFRHPVTISKVSWESIHRERSGRGGNQSYWQNLGGTATLTF
jgi:hypothetical protein